MSLAIQIIQRQLDHSGVLILKAASILTDDEFFTQPITGGSMAWSMAHISALQDWTIHRVFIKDEPWFLPETREALKGGRVYTQEDDDRLLTRDEIISQFSDKQKEVIRFLNTFTEDQWNVSTPSGCRFPTYGSLLEHLVSHNYWHLGQFSSSIPKLSTLTLTAPRFYTVDPEDLN